MSPHKRQRRLVVSDSDYSDDVLADGGGATAPVRRFRLRRAGDGKAAVDIRDEPAPGATAKVRRPPLGQLVTPQLACQPEAPTAERRAGLRDRGPSARKAPQQAALKELQRRRSGARAHGYSEDDKDEAGDGAFSSSCGSGAETQQDEEGSGAEQLSSSSEDGFVVSDDDEQCADAAMRELRGITGGSGMDEGGRLQLYGQLRLLCLLNALPLASSLSEEVKACLASALGVERNLLQFAAQSHNLEHWRHADPGMKARFEDFEVLEAEEGGYRWGKHCSFCRHDRHRKIAMLVLRFCGRQQRVVRLEPILSEQGLLPGSGRAAAHEHRTPDQLTVGAGLTELEDGSGASSRSSSGGSSSSSEDDELLTVGYARRQAVRVRQQRQIERAQRAQRQQAGTPLRARQVARELAAAGGSGDGSSSGEDSLLGGAGIAQHAEQRRLAGGKRRRVALESSDDEERQQMQLEQKQQDSPASSEDGSLQHEVGAAGPGSKAEEWSHGTDPDASHSSASELGKRPRRCPRIGTDCWARAYVYRALHRYPARLDAMLLYCTRRYLATTPEAEQPCSLAGLAHAVLQRYGHALVKHYNEFMHSINSFNLLQNRKKDKSFANACIVNELQALQYASFAPLSPEEERWGVCIDAELAAFTAAAAERRQRRLDVTAAAGRDTAAAAAAAAAAEAEAGEAEEDCGRLLLLRAAGGGGMGAADSEEEGSEGDVQYAAEEELEEPEEPGQQRRTQWRHGQQQQERLEVQFLMQRQRRPATAQQGGQRAAAAVAAAEYARQQHGAPGPGTTPAGSERQRRQRQQQQQQDEAATDRNACFYCGASGHWAAACPERQRCFHCKQSGHWSRDCPQLQHGSCYKCRQPGHWAANCPNS